MRGMTQETPFIYVICYKGIPRFMRIFSSAATAWARLSDFEKRSADYSIMQYGPIRKVCK